MKITNKMYSVFQIFVNILSLALSCKTQYDIILLKDYNQKNIVFLLKELESLKADKNDLICALKQQNQGIIDLSDMLLFFQQNAVVLTALTVGGIAGYLYYGKIFSLVSSFFTKTGVITAKPFLLKYDYDTLNNTLLNLSVKDQHSLVYVNIVEYLTKMHDLLSLISKSDPKTGSLIATAATSGFIMPDSSDPYLLSEIEKANKSWELENIKEVVGCFESRLIKFNPFNPFEK